MTRAALPPMPDFAAVEAAASSRAGDQQQQLLQLIGTLSLTWSNNESLFIYVLMILLDTDEVTAAVVFSTLNTTRARLDLITRLAALKVTDRIAAQGLARLVKRFDAGTRVRNEFGHCTYTIDEAGRITHTHAMRVQQAGGRLSFGEARPVDAARLSELSDAIRQMKRLNRDLWAFLPHLRAAMAAPEGS
jgi:hypothetical protein